MPLFAVVPAAGIGARMGGGCAKQYQLLDGLTVIEHAVSALLACSELQSLVVVVAADDTAFAELPVASDPRVTTAIGGNCRAESVRNGLLALEESAGNDSWVLVHDAARPLLEPFVLRTLIDAVRGHEVGGILALPLVDTIKQSAVVDSDAATIEKTLDRNQLWAAQTPQMFRYHLLRSSLSLALSAGEDITDESAAVERLGYQPLLVNGSRRNFKLTQPEDLALAQFYLQRD